MDLKLVRIDSRLIHGQVVTKWVKQTGADEILIIDDGLAKDDFMLSIYKMAAPSDIPVNVESVEDAIIGWKENKFEGKRIFILFKDVNTAYQCYQGSFPLKHIQIGGLGAGTGKKKIYGPIYFDAQDVQMLKEMDQNGIEIVLQQVPQEPSLSFEKALNKFK